MIIKVVVVLLTIIPSTIIGAIIANSITDNKWAIPLTKMKVGGVIGGILVYIGIFSSPYVVIATTLVPLSTNIPALLYNWNKNRQRENALDGEYGNLTQWGAELSEEGDDEFVIAMNGLTREDRMEIGIIADTKSELREKTIERFNEEVEEQ